MFRDPKSNDLSPLHLHHKSLTIPPPIKINRTGINNLDELFQLYDSQLSATIKKADGLIDQIEETSETTYTEYIAFTAFGLSIVNFIVFCVICRCIFRILGRGSTNKPPPPLPAQTSPHRHHEVCNHCSKPIKKDRRQRANKRNSQELQQVRSKEH